MTGRRWGEDIAAFYFSQSLLSTLCVTCLQLLFNHFSRRSFLPRRSLRVLRLPSLFQRPYRNEIQPCLRQFHEPRVRALLFFLQSSCSPFAENVSNQKIDAANSSAQTTTKQSNSISNRLEP